ncbi:toll/interleukin-1 receptor domain-containing protein [Frankia gtarii]|uniref:toll/interleukin-1 receptor domain-containing protein n=1 Tax=Frankia gtarii TaxID=2950102 RepID=UPI0021C179B0|nr:toll/interleukin-1 receptor domain-containing protein [Frankia gtarii]
MQTDSGADVEPRWDFFVSYTAADRPWAEWVAWQLEGAGLRVLVQAWDFIGNLRALMLHPFSGTLCGAGGAECPTESVSRCQAWC